MPNVAAGASGGLPTVNASNYVAGVVAAVVTDAASRTASQATGFSTPANVTDAVTAIKGADGDDLKDISDEIAGLNNITAAEVKTALEANGSKLTDLHNSMDGDVSIDTTTTPWELVIKLKDTGTELVRKKLYQADGTAVTAATHLVARQLESAP